MNIKELKVKAYNEITELAWSEDNAETVLQRILGVLYSVEQTMDYQSGELDVQAQLDSLTIRKQ